MAKKVGIFMELVWAAIGADQGWDSAFAGLIGSKFIFSKTSLKLGAGLFVWKFGSGNPSILPAPPIIALTFNI